MHTFRVRLYELCTVLSLSWIGNGEVDMPVPYLHIGCSWLILQPVSIRSTAFALHVCLLRPIRAKEFDRERLQPW